MKPMERGPGFVDPTDPSLSFAQPKGGFKRGAADSHWVEHSQTEAKKPAIAAAVAKVAAAAAAAAEKQVLRMAPSSRGKAAGRQAAQKKTAPIEELSLIHI